MSNEDGPAPRVAIGIAFGNSYSSIAHTSREGKAEVIANEDGDRQIPSILSYVQGEELHGQQAKTQLVRNPRNTIASFRDYLGKDFKSIDPTPCHQSAHPQEHESTVAFSIQDTESEDKSTVTVAEITKRHLRRLKESASNFLGKTVDAAVVTIPTDFTDAQKSALSDAAKEAGIEVLQFINEPTAAILAYDARPEAHLSDKIVVVADLGGTRSDVAVIASRGGMYSILATAHDYELGGAQLDAVLVDHFAKEFLKKHKGAKDPREDERGLAKLKLECESVKKALSLGSSASFSVESLAGGLDFTATINRSRYDLLASKVFGQFTRLITHAVEKAELDVLDIDEVILSGGTSHTPRVASNVNSVFPESTTILAPSTSPTAINPSELSARGAAYQVSLIQEYDKEDIEESTHPVVTATPHLVYAIGVLCISDDPEVGRFQPILDAETPVPVRKTVLVPAPKNGGDVLVKLVEGIKDIKVTKPDPKPKENGKAKDDDEDEDSDDLSDDEEEEVREKVWKAGRQVAEAAVKGVKAGGKVEVQVNVGPDLAVQIIAREKGGKGGVRGAVSAPAVSQNGSA